MVILLSNSETSDNVTDLKHDKAHRWTMASDSTTISDVESSEFRRTVIFSLKKSMNLLARSPSDAHICKCCIMPNYSFLDEVKGTHLFYSKRVVAQRESRLFQNVFSAASETMTLIFGVTE